MVDSDTPVKYADSDAEKDVPVNMIPRNIDFRLRNVQVKEKRSAAEEPEIDPNDTEHMKLYDEISNFHSFFGKLFGIKMSFHSVLIKQVEMWIAIVVLLSSWVSIAYTAFVHYANGNYIRILEPFVILGVAISCTQKQYAFFNYWKDIIAMLFNFRFISRLSPAGCTRSIVISAGFRKTLNLMKLFAAGFFVSVAVYFFIPVKVFLVNKELVPFIPMEIPFFDQSTLIGFLIANCLQAIMGFYGTICSVIYGLCFISTISNYTIGVVLIAEDFKDLDKMWNGAVQTTVAYRHAFLRNICRKRHDMNSYLKASRQIFETKIFFYFCANYFSQIICLFQIVTIDWQGGYGPLFALFVEMLFYCIMGTQMNVADDRLCFIVYDTNWFEYDLLSQRIILMLLKEAQMLRNLRLGFIGNLNLPTFVQVVKSIYTYYTILLELL